MTEKRKRKPLMVLRGKIYPYGVPMLYEIKEQAQAKGLKIEDLIGKRLAVKILVGKRYRIKSFRLFEAEYINMCDCCGPEPFLRYRLNGKEYKGLSGIYKEVTPAIGV